MATSIVIPREGQSMETAVIVKWLSKVGDKISFAQPICEVESEKALFEIESPVEGTLLEIYFEEGDTAPVLKAIAVIGDPGENIEDMKPQMDAEKVVEQNVSDEKEALPPQSASKEVDTFGNERILISPRAKKLLRENNIDPILIAKELIKEKDVLNFIENSVKITPAAAERISKTGESVPDKATGIGGRVTIDDLIRNEQSSDTFAIKGIRKTIADRMYNSLQMTAQFTLNTYVDATGLLDLRKRLKESELGLASISINDIILLCVARTLASFPALNVRFAEEIITQVKEVNLGFAVDAEKGLMVPVIKSAQNLSLKQISDKAKQLANECREGKIKQDNLKGGTFTVSNLGAMGIESFTPILNYPEVGILGIGAILLRPVELNDSVEFVKHIALSLTLNHQVIDGAVGARFLKVLADNLRNIDTLLAI